MSNEDQEIQEQFDAILADELENKGVDWNSFVRKDGSLIEEAVDKHVSSLQSIADSTAFPSNLVVGNDSSVDMVSASIFEKIVDKADLSTPIALERKQFLKDTKDISKNKVKKYILRLIELLKKIEKELAKPFDEIDWDAVNVANSTFKLIGTSVSAYALIAAIPEVYGATAFVASMISLGAGAAVAAIAVGAAIAVVIAVLVVVFLVFRSAQMLIMVANTSMENNIEFSDFYRHHGKITLVPGDTNNRYVLPKGEVDKNGDEYIFVSFISTSKKDSALYGTEGAFRADVKDPSGKSIFHLYQSYAVPLTGTFGGKNGVYMGTGSNYKSSKNFWDKKASDKVHGKLSDFIKNSIGEFKVNANSKTGQGVCSILTFAT